MTWTDERIDELSQLWQAGHSASEIGKRLGVSKNAVVGKAHRLKLPSRPSPIKQQDLQAGTTAGKAHSGGRKTASQSRRPAPQPAAANGAPAQPRQAPAPAQSNGNAAARPAVAAQNGASPRQASAPRSGASNGGGKARAAAARGSGAARTSSNSSGCLWPIGDPSDSDFHFCGAQPMPGKPYCSEHAARAYITRSRSHADEEAA